MVDTTFMLIYEFYVSIATNEQQGPNIIGLDRNKKTSFITLGIPQHPDKMSNVTYYRRAACDTLKNVNNLFDLSGYSVIVLKEKKSILA